MSLETDIMDRALELMGQSYPEPTVARTLTTARGYTNPEQIPPDQLPFAQAFEPVTTSTDETFQQQIDTLTFRIVLYDVRGRNDKLRDGVETLSREISRDPTLGGLVRETSVSAFVTIPAVGSDKATAGVEIVATYATQGIFNEVGEDVELLTQSTFQDTVVSNVPDEIRAGQFMPGTIELKKVNTFFASVAALYDPVNGYPSVDVFQPTRFARFSVYLRSELDVGPDIVVQARALLFITDTFFNSYDSQSLRSGWNLFRVDLDDPDSGTNDLSTTPVVKVSLQFISNNVTHQYADFSAIIARVFYAPEDRR